MITKILKTMGFSFLSILVSFGPTIYIIHPAGATSAKEEIRRLKLGITYADPVAEVCVSSKQQANTSTGVSTVPGNPKPGKPMPDTVVNVGDEFKGTASFYGNDPVIGYVDAGDNNEPASEKFSNNDTPGIAIYNGGTLDGWWEVTSKDGISAIIQQTDVGPSTEKVTDINAVAARSIFGYAGDEFPTGEGEWKVKYLGLEEPPGAIKTDTKQKKDVGTVSTTNTTNQTTQNTSSVDFSGELPAEVRGSIDSKLSSDKLEPLRARYDFAAQATGVPWQAIAALHFREGGSDPGKSIADGEPLSDSLSIDGVQMSSDPNEDAKLAAEHFIEMSKSVYGVDPTKPGLGLEDWAKAFVAYNRGGAYKEDNWDVLTSPYALNGYDEQHLNMTWQTPDERINRIANGGRQGSITTGKVDGNPGALAVVKYLGGLSISSGGNSSCSGSSASGGSIAEVAERELKKNGGTPEYGGSIKEYTLGREEAWCADFVSWVYKESGQPFTDGPYGGGWQHPSVSNLQDWFKEKHTYIPVGTQPPQVGDVAFYIGAQTPDGGSSSHVNLVIAVNGDSMSTIGGNEGDTIKKSERKIALGENSLVGFGRLKSPGAPGENSLVGFDKVR